MDTLFIPTREQVAGIEVGGLAINTFGEMAEVTEIFAKREDVKGNLFCCYYTKFGVAGGAMSNSIKAGELYRGAYTSARFLSEQLWRIERYMLANNVREMSIEAAQALS